MHFYKTYLNRLWKKKIALGLSQGIALFSALMFFVRYFLEGVSHPSLYLLIILSALFWLAGMISKRTDNYTALTYLIFLGSLVILPIRAAATGGASSSVITWFMLIPLLSIIMMGKIVGMIITVATLLHFALILYFKPSIYLINDVDVSTLTQFMVLTIGLGLAILLAVVYENNREALNNQLLASYQKLEESANLKTRNEQLEGAQGMVRTYNHEINNPLQIALGNLALYQRKGDPKSLQKVQESLIRIGEITKKISDSVNHGQIHFGEVKKENEG